MVRPACSYPVLFLAAIFSILSMTTSAAGSEEINPPPVKSFTLYWENDSFTGTDRDYTNGLKLTWSRPYTPSDVGEENLTDWMMGHLPMMGDPDTQRATSFSIGQNIYTPEDTESASVVEDDRPYAGFSYLGFGFVSNNMKRRDVWEIDIGVVGPLSQGQVAQDVAHDMIGSDRAKGWDNQLENELALELICESKWRLWQASHHSGFGADFIPHVGGRVGNVSIYANAGAELRFGWLMPRDFGTCPIRPGCNAGSALDGSFSRSSGGASRKFGLHFFTAFEGRAIMRDIFFDGNTFENSHSVDKEMYVADMMGGVALHFGRLRMNYTYVLRTREFEQQNDNHSFGAVSLTYIY